jgi:cytochrome P450
MALQSPPPLTTNPIRRVAGELVAEGRVLRAVPPGDRRPSVSRTRAMIRDPLNLLLDAYERHGPVFSLRVLHANNVFVLGPEANHFVLVSGADHFRWRDGAFADLIPLLGDGLLTIDGDFHRRSRRIMLPAFHRERIAGYRGVMEEEAHRGLEQWREGETVDLYRWTRHVALRVAMRALFGLDPDRARAGGLNAAAEFESALSFYGRDYLLQILRGPRTPFSQMLRSRHRLDALLYEEIDRRRASGERGEDILSMLLDASDEDGASLDRAQIRDEVMTLLFAGHDTTTSTVAFMLYELTRNPEVPDDGATSVEMIIDETLRKYPPAYIGPRRSIEPFEFEGHRVPGNAHVQYCSWASHHLPDVWPEPEEFRPRRFTEENKAELPRGAYVPFGGGSRTCIGMRFGQAEIALIARGILERFRLELEPGFTLDIRQAPTISPRDGLPMRVRAAAPAAVLAG